MHMTLSSWGNARETSWSVQCSVDVHLSTYVERMTLIYLNPRFKSFFREGGGFRINSAVLLKAGGETGKCKDKYDTKFSRGKC